MDCYSRHRDFDRKEDFRRLELILKDILIQLQQQGQAQGQEQGQAQGQEQGQAQGQEQGQAQGQEQGQAQGQDQSDRTKFENIGNPNIVVKNEANAYSIAAFFLLYNFLNDYTGNVVVEENRVREAINMLKEFDNFTE